jgi:hypothetical protein
MRELPQGLLVPAAKRSEIGDFAPVGGAKAQDWGGSGVTAGVRSQAAPVATDPIPPAG